MPSSGLHVVMQVVHRLNIRTKHPYTLKKKENRKMLNGSHHFWNEVEQKKQAKVAVESF